MKTHEGVEDKNADDVEEPDIIIFKVTDTYFVTGSVKCYCINMR